jgi:hypothetical protein
VWKFKHLNWEKCCVAIQTSEFGKRRYVEMKVLNQGKVLCGNTNIQTVKKGLCEHGKFTVEQYKILSKAKVSA